MEQRRLGESSLAVAPLAFGGDVFGWTTDEPTSFALLDAFVDAGFNLTDTADNYSRWAHNGIGGQSETIIGRWLARNGKRDRIVYKGSRDPGPCRQRVAYAYPTR